MIKEVYNWKMDRKYVIRRRWFFGSIIVIGLAIIFYATGHIWWVGDHWCLGSLDYCEGGL